MFSMTLRSRFVISSQSYEHTSKSNTLTLVLEKQWEERKELKSLATRSSSNVGAASMVYSCTMEFKINRFVSVSNSKLFHNSKYAYKHWILDSSAIDHMTPNPSNFTSYVLCSSNRKVQTTNGSLLKVAGIGEIKLDPIGIIKDVLNFPKLCISLVSEQKLAKILEIAIYFDEDYSFLPNKVSKQRIGLSNIGKGLYIMNNQHQVATCRYLEKIK